MKHIDCETKDEDKGFILLSPGFIVPSPGFILPSPVFILPSPQGKVLLPRTGLGTRAAGH